LHQAPSSGSLQTRSLTQQQQQLPAPQQAPVIAWLGIQLAPQEHGSGHVLYLYALCLFRSLEATIMVKEDNSITFLDFFQCFQV
jgi:hypothetical protein